MDIFGIIHAINWIYSCHVELPCGGFVVQVSVLFSHLFVSFCSLSQDLEDFAIILVLFCPHLDSFTLPFTGVFPFSLFSFL